MDDPQNQIRIACAALQDEAAGAVLSQSESYGKGPRTHSQPRGFEEICSVRAGAGRRVKRRIPVDRTRVPRTERTGAWRPFSIVESPLVPPYSGL
jgi:hypothetical protein